MALWLGNCIFFVFPFEPTDSVFGVSWCRNGSTGAREPTELASRRWRGSFAPAPGSKAGGGGGVGRATQLPARAMGDGWGGGGGGYRVFP